MKQLDKRQNILSNRIEETYKYMNSDDFKNINKKEQMQKTADMIKLNEELKNVIKEKKKLDNGNINKMEDMNKDVLMGNSNSNNANNNNENVENKSNINKSMIKEI